MTRALFTFAAALLLTACGGKSGGVKYVDESVTSLEPVGWLGARVQPLTRDLTVRVEDGEHVPGGVVVRELDPGQPLANAGLRTGDVIVRVGTDWMPLKRDMQLDFVRLVEQGVSAGQTEIELSVWRDGALETVKLHHDQTPLEAGLPVNVERFASGAQRALERVRATEPTPAAAAWIALAALAAGASADAMFEAALTKVRARVAADSAGARALAWGLLLEAETLGALPAAYVLAARPGGAEPHRLGAAAPPVLPPGGKVVRMTPEQMRALMERLEKMGGAVKVSGGSPGLPPGLVPGGAPKVTPGKPSGAKKAPPAPDAAALLEKHDPRRVQKLAPLRALAQRLAALQHEDGGWSVAKEGESDVESTSLVLWSYGALHRAGGSAPAAAVEKGIQYLRKALNEGRLSIEVAKGADRRVEAGRGALAALALRALGCPDTDEMLVNLWKFSDRFGAEVPDAGREEALYLLATAIGRRARGLATWSTFYDEFRVRLIAAQRPDGSFAPFGASDDAQRATAAGALLLALQKEAVPVLLGKAENPLAPRWDSQGKQLSGAQPPAPRAGKAAAPADVKKLLEGLGVKPGGK